MLKFSANLSMMFNEVSFDKRFAAAGKAGFTTVEMLFPYAYRKKEVAQFLAEQELQLSLFNTPPGNWEQGERGLSIFPERQKECKESIDLALEYAALLKPANLHLMSGILTEELPFDEAESVYKENISYAAQGADRLGLPLLLEPICNIDGYFLDNFDYAVQLITDFNQQGLHNVKLQFDVYHCYCRYNEVINRIRKYYELVAHYQIAGSPGRHEPDQGEINYQEVFELLEEYGYRGFIGCEYKPLKDTQSGLSWLNHLLSS